MRFSKRQKKKYMEVFSIDEYKYHVRIKLFAETKKNGLKFKCRK